METKFTKGEWVCKVTSTSSDAGVTSMAIYPKGRHGLYDPSICRIQGNHTKSDLLQDNFPEFEANAKLIAAAPEMFKMLERLINEISALQSNDLSVYYNLGVWRTEANLLLHKIIE